MQIIIDFCLAMIQTSRRSASLLLTTREDNKEGTIAFEKPLREWVTEQHDPQHAATQKPHRTSSLSRLFSTTSWAKKAAAAAATTTWATTSVRNIMRSNTMNTNTTHNNNNNATILPFATTAVQSRNNNNNRTSNHPSDANDRGAHRRSVSASTTSPTLRPSVRPSRDNSWSVTSIHSSGGSPAVESVQLEDDNDENDDDLENPPDGNENKCCSNRSDYVAILNDTLLGGVYPHVQVTASVSYSLTILSAILDALMRSHNNAKDSDHEADGDDVHGGGRLDRLDP